MTDPAARSTLVSSNVNNSTLVMGPTGSGKTSLIATLAEWGYLTYGATTFLYSSDGGGYPDRVSALIARGIVKVFRMRSRNGGDDSLALETSMKASKGWWPARINPQTGMTDPNVPMVPPRVQNPDGSWRINKGFPERRIVAFDGLSSLSNWWVDDMQARAGRLEITGGEKGGGIGVIVSGTERFSGGSRSQIGFAQNRAHQFVLNTNGIPDLALPPVFTALTNEATDEAALRICGPKFAGQAKTDEGPQWFGNVLESRQANDDKGNRLFRLWLTEFVENGIRHLCKNRAEAGLLPMYLQDPAPELVQNGVAGQVSYPGAFTEFSLGRFFELMEAAHARSLQRLMDDPRFAQAPGLQTEEFGDAPQGTMVAVPAAPGVTVPRAPAPVTPASAPAAAPRPAAPPPVPGSAPAPAPAPRPAVPAAAARPAPVAPAPAPNPAAPPPVVAAPSMRTVPPPPPGAPKAPTRAPAPPPPAAKPA